MEDRVNKPLNQDLPELDERRRQMVYDALVSAGQLDLFDVRQAQDKAQAPSR